MSKNRWRRSCIRSRPRRSARAADSTMSQKSTVTRLCSPSSALRLLRMRSARCRGVYATGEAKRAESNPAAVPGWGRPHAPQKRLPGATIAPHARHDVVMGDVEPSVAARKPQAPRRLVGAAPLVADVDPAQHGRTGVRSRARGHDKPIAVIDDDRSPPEVPRVLLIALLEAPIRHP